MKLLGLTRYDTAGASSRLRSLQYSHALAEADIDVCWKPLFGNQYIDDLYSRRAKSRTLVTMAYARRLLAIATSRRYDLVWLEKEAFPWLPGLIDPGLLLTGPPYVVDLDDAVFHYYDQSQSGLVRGILGRKIDLVMRRSALVVAGNRYLERRALAAGARAVAVVPTSVDVDRYAFETLCGHSGFTVGWIGSPSTQRYLEPLVPLLSEILTDEADRFVTVGARFREPLFLRHHVHEWSESTEAQEIADFDVGIMPLPDSPFERGKCGYKLIQYMAAGKSVVASPVGANRDIVNHRINGFLAGNPEEWRVALKALKSDSSLRTRMGRAGRALVEEQYSTAKSSQRIISLLESVANGSRRA